MSAALNERLVAIAQAARSAPHGMKGAIYAQACEELGLSRPTLLRKLAEAAHRPARKRRRDAGETALTLDEAKLISAMLVESTRRNGKRLMSIEQAVSTLRANGKIQARTVDEETGEVFHLSVGTVARALRLYNLHPDQLTQPAPAIELASLHPNHVWAADASLCVLYYLKREAGAQHGLQVMDAAEFYKNKPKNLKRIEHDRVWRYLYTDHASGAFYLEYVLGAESGENLAGSFINAIQKRADDPFHGVPWVVMLDPGSANTGAVFRNLAHALQVQVQVNEPGNPRAKGQVEKTHDIVERQFESGLKFVAVDSLAELNALAWRWMRVFNATRAHSRHKQTRWGAWQRITPEQLRLAPDPALCRELAHSAPVLRTVTPKLRVSFGAEFDVSGVPGVMVGEKLLMARNPWRPEAAQVVLTDEHGHQSFHVVEPVTKDEWGFAHGAPVIGEAYQRHADTPAQVNAKAIERLVTGADTQQAAAAARKAKALPFGGEIDPYKPVTDTVLPAYLPRRGTELNVPMRAHVEVNPLSPIEAAGVLMRMVPGWNREHMQRLKAGWPEGVLEQDLPEVAARLAGRAETTAPRLAAVK